MNLQFVDGLTMVKIAELHAELLLVDQESYSITEIGAIPKENERANAAVDVTIRADFESMSPGLRQRML